MRRLTTVFAAIVLLCLAAMPSVAQAQVRTPVIVAATTIDSVFDAHPFHPDVQIIVTGVEAATIEGSEPDHSCAAGVDGNSVWFATQLPLGTLTLDTLGSSYTTGSGTSSNTVITLYQMTDNGVADFSDLAALACNDNGTGAGIINAFAVPSADVYYVQVSTPGLTVTGASQINLTVNFTAAIPLAFDEPENARVLKFPGLPTVANLNTATVSMNEPFDPLGASEGPVTNTIWFKFTLTARRLVGFFNFYVTGSDTWFSVFEKSGAVYLPMTENEIVSYSANSLSAILDPGTYYLRVGQLDNPRGAALPFVTFATVAFLSAPNLGFGAGNTEGTAGATPTIEGWTVKNPTPGPSGDTVFCDSGPTFSCGFRFVSSGAGEATQLVSKLTLSAVKLKKGDLIVIQSTLLNVVGTPNLKATLILTNAAGATQKYSLSITHVDSLYHASTVQVAAPFTPVKAVFKVRNSDTVFGNSVELDDISSGVLRTGEGVLRGGTLKLLLGGELSEAWTGTPDGVLSVPPAP